ncbi:hypothetical protein PQC07_gp260 [Aeromonas phage D3]|uniref:Uncharacterized protein n=2 Tax=Ludhianavirus TaxID=3044751 RepID=A0A514TVI3_9CAUD|nr:hypothetical protein PQC07_gp260 [Aeromonas phage D3]YP_010668764.1 hypothetical protein PQC08_gp259 [Aeromonas phage D6]QDJ97014.1 hypothetical protein D3_0015 [Aeromonas phage D3]QDJ97176.1 hypothetical protein D6_0016 [Aeromonas phage D6]
MMKDMNTGWVHGLTEFADAVKRIHSRVHYYPIQKFHECVTDFGSKVVFDTLIGIDLIFKYENRNDQYYIDVSYRCGRSKTELFLCTVHWKPMYTKKMIMSSVIKAMAKVMWDRMYAQRTLSLKEGAIDVRTLLETPDLDKDIKQVVIIESQKRFTDYSMMALRYHTDFTPLSSLPVFIG